MNLDKEEPLSADVEALLVKERIVESQPEPVRRRVVSRARAVMWGGSSTVPVRSGVSGWGLSLAVAAVMISTALSAAAIRARVNSRASLIDPPTAAQNPQTAVTAPAAPMSSTNEQKDIQDQVTVTVKNGAPIHGAHGAPTVAPRTSLELNVLQPARSAVALRDFSSALPILAEHERRFPTGRLAEEREALRVQALSGMGRMEEASRAAAAFRERFPGSVLLSRMRLPERSL